MNTEIRFCCEEMRRSILQSEINMNIRNEVTIITINYINEAVEVVIKYCPHCGKKVTMKTGGK